MAKTTAQNKQQVDEMTPYQKKWDSLTYAYDKKKEASNQSYDKAISQFNNSLLGRGMQRSSYGAIVGANMYTQKLNAANDIDSEKIADYENWAYQLDKDEDERAYRDKAFDQQVRQYDEGFAYQKEQDALKQAFDREQFEYGKDSDDRKYAYELALSMIQNGKTPSDDLLARAGISKDDVATIVGTATSNASGGTPYWRSLGFASEKDYSEARKAGLTRDASTYYANKNGTGTTPTGTASQQGNLQEFNDFMYGSGTGTTGNTSSAFDAFRYGYNNGRQFTNEYKKTAKK